MRIRTIKPGFYLHEGLYDLEMETGLPIRVAYSGLWCAADREGRFPWKPRTLKACILPYDNLDFSRVLDALATRGFIVRYASNGEEFGYIPTFHRHQVINNRERASELPQPPVAQHVDASATRDARDDHANPLSESGREGKGREGKGLGAHDDYEPSFLAWWNEYPTSRRTNQSRARSLWRDLSHADRQLALDAIGAFRIVVDAAPEARRTFFKQADRWLAERCWTDDPESWRQTARQDGNNGQRVFENKVAPEHRRKDMSEYFDQ